eukprot:COSAG06_NODE_2073_length_7659_cov_7.896825_3_plen_32_part_00
MYSRVGASFALPEDKRSFFGVFPTFVPSLSW